MYTFMIKFREFVSVRYGAGHSQFWMMEQFVFCWTLKPTFLNISNYKLMYIIKNIPNNILIYYF